MRIGAFVAALGLIVATLTSVFRNADISVGGKIVWAIDPNDPDFGTQAPSLRGDTKSIRVVCSADVMHSCGYACLDGVLVESAKKR